MDVMKHSEKVKILQQCAQVLTVTWTSRCDRSRSRWQIFWFTTIKKKSSCCQVYNLNRFIKITFNITAHHHHHHQVQFVMCLLHQKHKCYVKYYINKTFKNKIRMRKHQKWLNL